MYYKGKKVLKSKLIEDYLANISDKNWKEKDKEKNNTVNENTNKKIKEMKNEIIIKQLEIKKESRTVKIKKNDKIEIKSLMMIIRSKFNI